MLGNGASWVRDWAIAQRYAEVRKGRELGVCWAARRSGLQFDDDAPLDDKIGPVTFFKLYSVVNDWDWYLTGKFEFLLP